MDAIEIVPASREDVVAASDILCEAAEWLEERGIPLWNREQLTVERLLPIVERGELFLASRAGQAIATMILQEEDTFFWPDVPAGESLFLHKLAVRRSAAGQGIAHAMLEWAAEEARRRGKTYLRLDTDGTRPRLCALYESAGFTLHSTRQIKTFPTARYERRL
jgi:GNAT superfamily N-acetyltransferase